MFQVLRSFVLVAACLFGSPSGADVLEAPSGYRSETTLKIAYFFGSLELIDTHIALPDDVIENRNVEYNRVGGISLKLDLYSPKEISGVAPLLVFIHGGAWKKGDKGDYQRYLVEFAQRGFVTASVQYRFSQQAKFPAAVQDVKCAVRWLKAHADELGIDRDNIAVIGGSAGGHLAMMVAYSTENPVLEGQCGGIGENSKVQAVVNLYGPSDLTTERAKATPSIIQFLGASQDNDIYALASPVSYINEHAPPTLIFHGTLDSLVPVSQSDNLTKKLMAEGVSVDFHKLEGWPHTMDLSKKVNAYVQQVMWQFFQQELQVPVNQVKNEPL